MNNEIINKILDLKKDLNALIVAHYYQRDEIVKLADFCGDSLELARVASRAEQDLIVFCGVSFMGQSVKVLSPKKRVIMPRLACCSMARMIDSSYFDISIKKLNSLGIDNIFPMTYINSNADVKAKVGKMGGVVCTSANATKIFDYALSLNKKIFFMPDRCLGVNLANKNNKLSSVLGQSSDSEIIDSDVICYDGFCSVHQLFSVSDIEFYKNKFSDILIVTHPECDPKVVEKSDFVGSTSQIINFISNLPKDAKVAVGTEFNLVNRLTKQDNNKENIFVLSSSKPECPTMNETTLQDLYNVMRAFKDEIPYNEIEEELSTIEYASLALNKMLELSR
ncbi:quinolinate synthase NadA [Helicobacter sp. MIT 14-3879]|uniref:quinolinate synthase NadA n=1 Tax=Helicobacter sp. MIT 14-3879 TaxID=2040649 RepID=UPI000E1E568E|nr:quinolinate synthase NadA [Helicobacter sp. MIT 14-3879]RDU63489.1 quinolinate synthase NadA [Helicobacter sp. MIT 14-3879]